MEKCQACRFFLPADDAQGFCRRYPPQPITTPEGGLFSQFPIMLKDGWCGEYQERKS